MQSYLYGLERLLLLCLAFVLLPFVMLCLLNIWCQLCFDRVAVIYETVYNKTNEMTYKPSV